MGQGVAILPLQGANFDAAKDFYPARVFFFQRLDMVVIADERLFVVGVKTGAFVPTKLRPSAAYAVVVVANTKLLNAACYRRFDNRLGTVIRAKGIVGVCV